MLLLRARAGDESSIAELYRRHRGDAERYARALSRRNLGRDAAEDVLAEAMHRVIVALSRGHGPRTGFRPYLFTAVRTVTLNLAERRDATLDSEPDDRDIPLDSPDDDDRFVVRAALMTLPEQWRRVLWLTAGLDLTPSELAPVLGMSRAAVATMAMRARAALRTAYVREHLPAATGPHCRRALDLLARDSSVALTQRQRSHLDTHLTRCEPCGEAARRLADEMLGWRRSPVGGGPNGSGVDADSSLDLVAGDGRVAPRVDRLSS